MAEEPTEKQPTKGRHEADKKLMEGRPVGVTRQLLHTSDVMLQLQVTRDTAYRELHDMAKRYGRKLKRVGVYTNISIHEFCKYYGLDEAHVRSTLPATPPNVPRRLRKKSAPVSGISG